MSVLRSAAAALAVMLGTGGNASSLTRSLPEFYRAGEPVEVTVAARPDGGVEAYGVEEHLPAGWIAEAVSHDGVLDAASGRVRWGPFFDGAARDLTVRVLAPAGSTGSRSISGLGQFGSVRVATAGPSIIQSVPSAITGTLPEEAVPGGTFEVFLAVSPAEGVGAYSVSDTVPVGWTVSGISHAGVLDPGTGAVKWGPFTDGNPRTLQYRVGVPPTARGEFGFVGRGVFDQTEVGVRGRRTIRARDHRLRRSAPASYLPGIPFDVVLRAEPLPAVSVFSIEEQLPAGWVPVSVTPPGSFDPFTGRIKWGPIQGSAPVDLGYRIAPPTASGGEVRLSGIGVFDSRPVVATGADRLVAAGSSVVRSLPPRFQPGTHLTVSLLVTPLPLNSVWAVEEPIPAGWGVDQISGGGVFDAARGRIKWREFDVAGTRVLSYRLLPPAGAIGEFHFDGLGVFDLDTVETGGARTTVSGSRVEREVAPGFRPGSTLPVVLQVEPLAGTSVQSVEETVPDGWTVESVDGGGVLDPLVGRVKWGPFTDGTPRRLTLTLRAPVSGPGVVPLSGRGNFDGVPVTTLGPGELVRIDNRAPVAFDDVVERSPGAGARTRVETLLANDADPDSPGLALTLPDTVTERGGRVRLEDGWVVYEPPSGGDPAEDSYLYFAEDGQGGRDLARVTVRIGSGPGEPATLLIPEWDGAAWVVRFTGTPGASYEIQSTPFLGDPSGWTPLATVVVGPDGQGVYRDTASPAGFRLYRAVHSGGGNPPEATLLTPERDGAVWVIRFTGAAGRTYRVQAADSLLLPTGWTTLGTVVAGDGGSGSFRDTSPPPGVRLYRLELLP